ncbi:hypothetical protein F5Y19DRAFT_135955 [Xylariaceae sp. FL1651]|nr:hypothetical protein F5Y19DRAFT_135955 [Xylariaceae sp. FL1651]
MEDPPPSTQQTHRSSLDVNLNTAIFHFAPRYMKEKLEHLAHEYDQRLERDLVPRLHTLLREIDQERDAFEQQKRNATNEIREHLGLLRFDAASVEDAIGQLRAVAPKYLHLIPKAECVTIPISTKASFITPSIASSGNIPEALGVNSNSQTATSLSLTQGTSSHSTQLRTTQAESGASPPRASSSNSQVQARIISGNSTASCSPKRPRTIGQNENDNSSKRQIIADDKGNPGAIQIKEITRRVAFPNLTTGECIFRHSKHRGFFVIRCDRCEPGSFSEPPLAYNRALKHFQKHGEKGPDGEELTNEYIFEKFACQVDGEELASKYWIREHIGAMPHIFVPMKCAIDTSCADDTENMVRKHQEIDNYFSPPLPLLRESPHNHSLDHDEDQDKPRRTRRNVPRPDYAEMVANRDPWTPEVDTEKTFTAINVTQSTSSVKRRLTKPGISSTPRIKTESVDKPANKTGTTEPTKPFGYMSEPWPRRSAPS